MTQNIEPQAIQTQPQAITIPRQQNFATEVKKEPVSTTTPTETTKTDKNISPELQKALQ